LASSLPRLTTIAIAAMLSACAAPQMTSPPPPRSISAIGANPAPQRKVSRGHKIQQARASWYGRSFAGHKTTTGEKYDPEGLTAASTTLPLGTMVIVSNPNNGKSVKVRINDRGPFVHGRNLDLSHRAARTLGILHKGVARVEVERLSPPSTSIEIPASGAAGGVKSE